MTRSMPIYLAFSLALSADLWAATPCMQTARDVSQSCNSDAQGDYQLALAKCDNVADPTSQTACQQEASADLRDHQLTCRDQFNARDDACDLLGPAAYDPPIDPASFVAVIDNPFFPLTPGTTFVYEGQTSEGFNHTEFAVTRNTRVIDGVTCVEVRDTVHLDGALAEDTFDWFAQDGRETAGTFGENTKDPGTGFTTRTDAN